MDLDRRNRWETIEKLMELKRRIEALESHAGGEHLGDWSPAVDIIDEGDRYRVLVDVPGVKPEDLELAEEGRSLTIAGFRQGAEGRFIAAGRPSGYFRRTLKLPESIREGEAQASIKMGVLEISVPKNKGRSVPIE